MDKKKIFDHAKKAVAAFFRIRRGYKIYIAFATGIMSGIAIYGEIYEKVDNVPGAVALSVLLGIFITVAMLLVMDLIRWIIQKAGKAGTTLLSKYKERKQANEKEE